MNTAELTREVHRLRSLIGTILHDMDDVEIIDLIDAQGCNISDADAADIRSYVEAARLLRST